MQINWKVRAKNKTFWLTLIPAILLVVQIISGWFGFEIPADMISQEVTVLVNAVFAVLMILGIVTDPTTSGSSDSKQARMYHKPKKD